MSAPPSDVLSSDLTVVAPPIPGRKCYKKTKERKEAIWAPKLEGALVEALEKYRPTTGLRDTRLLRRFPKRNQFISDHILSVTGTRRTAKQVGSRLQQMRDTCADDRILNLLSRREYSPGDSASTPSDSSLSAELTASSTASSPVLPTSDITDVVNPENWMTSSTPPRTFVSIELIPPSSGGPISAPLGIKYSHNNRQCISLVYPSEMENDDPLLTYSTPRKISTSQHYSHFRVLIGGIVAHSEVTQLTLVSVGTARYTYSTQLIPRFWRQLCRTALLFQCLIEQDILKTQTPFDAVPASPRANDESIRAITYEFSLSRTTAPPVFHPPALRADPSLPPGFPRIGYASLFTPVQPATKTNDSSLASALTPRHSSSPAKYMRNEEYAVYGWNLDAYAPPAAHAQATDGLFSGTIFPGAPVVPSPLFPYYSSSPNSSAVLDPHPGLFASASMNQWPGEYDTNTTNANNGVHSPTWSDAPMYLELNADSF